MSICRSCGAQIDWVKTTAGKNMPVEGEHVEYNDAEEGMVLITDGGNVYKVTPDKHLPSVKGRISHFSTCPNADDWRKK